MTAGTSISWGHVQAPTGANVPLAAVPDYVEVVPVNIAGVERRRKPAYT